MKCILLCAGYATRLFPLTENFPKALLEIGNRPLLDYILDEVNTIDEVDNIYVITNDRYYKHFDKWATEKDNIKKIKVISDNTTSNDDRLGAIGDIMYVINKENINDDLLIIAGDNLFTYKLKDVINFYNQKQNTVVCAKELDDIELLKRFAVAQIDNTDKVIDIEEKPNEPKSNLGVYATYIYPREVLNYFETYKNEGNNMDSPGHFPQYLYKREDIYVYKFNGECYDVGTHETLKEVNKIYSRR
ncbi:MAG: nucleotidyltransferase family protein [Firmicutes bacterium]|nr:nucleotidyltransferase family protein [Bacillota bacterium]